MLGRNHMIVHCCSVLDVYAATVWFGRQKIVPDTAMRFLSFLQNQAWYWTPKVVKNVVTHFLKPFPYTVSFFGVMFPKEISFLLCFLAFLFGSILPDIDSKNSLLGKHMPFTLQHRGWCHTIWFSLPFFMLSVFFFPFFWMGIGMLLHLFWDSFSAAGLSFFSPARVPNGQMSYALFGHRLRFYHTGKMSEYVVVGVVVLLTIFVVFQAYMHGYYTGI